MTTAVRPATLAELRTEGLLRPPVTGGHIAVKEAVLPFNRFPEVDTALGPEMRSTGEVMGISEDLGIAFAKSQMASGFTIPTEGTVFISVNDFDKGGMLPHARELARMGFHILATRGTVEFLGREGVTAEMVYKVNEGRPHIGDEIVNGTVDLIVNTPLGRESFFDDRAVRRAAMMHEVPCITTLTGAAAAVSAAGSFASAGLAAIIRSAAATSPKYARISSVRCRPVATIAS